MSKSLGNQIGITDPPEEMYGRTMAIPDRAMAEYYRLLLGRELTGERAPRDAKRRLARELVAWLHDDAAAERAEAHFDRVFVAKEQPAGDRGGAVRRRDGTVHLPGLIAAAVRRLALGGPPADRPGRRLRSGTSSSRRASTTSRRSGSTARY